MTHPKFRSADAAFAPARHALSRNRDRSARPRRDPHCRLITQLLTLAGPDSSVLATSSRPWASATFIGHRHSIRLRLSGPDQEAQAERLTAALPEAEFALGGHLVADAEVSARSNGSAEAKEGKAAGRTIELLLSVLTIEDW